MNGHAELSEYVTAALGSTNAMCRDISSLVIQEVVQGDEYVVDGAVVNGIPTAISVGVYRKTWSQGFPVYKSLTWLTEHEVPRYGELIEYLRECLGALGVRVGCFHFEAFDRGSEWTMMEVGLRPHGGGHPLYTETLTGGISQVSVELATCLGGEVAIDGLPRLGIRGRVVFFAVDQQSTVISDPRERIGSAPYVLESHIAVSPGDAVTPPKSLFDTFALGFAVITGDTWDELETREVNVRALFAGCFSAAV
ncbi:hypothetical protein AWC01_07795 [Mycobacterium doricum]|uniref:ATP-grasp domain-containing protein n=1 Tax=Mycolicibacterium doricum TaxID=126673 RepID=A0A1X1TDI2_9MYCO|nr:hypothetical protein AWC01_07795 [Mycolicibacterium doricum]